MAVFSVTLAMGQSTNCPNTTNIGLDFDGIDDYVALPNESSFDFTNQMTVEMWFKIDQFDKPFQTLIAKGDVAWRIAREGSTDQLAFATNGLSNFKIVGASNVNDGQWHHVAAVYDGSTQYLYIDGLLDATAPATGNIDNTSFPVFVGENAQATGRHFNGQIDEVRIWRVAKSQTQIQASLDVELTGDESQLTAYYNFNEGVPNQDNFLVDRKTIDQSNSGNSGDLTNFDRRGTISNWVEGAPINFDATKDRDQDGVPDECDTCPLTPNPALDLDGTNDYVQKTNLNEISTGNTSHTIEGWVYLDGYPSVRSWLMNFGQFSTGAHHWLINSDGSIQFGVFNGSVQFTNNLPANEWIHLATTYNGSDYTFYINGASQGTLSASFNFTNTDFNLGRRFFSGDQFFDGKIDEFRVWNTARTQQEIQDNRFKELIGNEAGLIANYNFNEGIPNTNNTNVANTALSRSYNGNDATIFNLSDTGTASNWVIGAPVPTWDSDNDGLGYLCDDENYICLPIVGGLDDVEEAGDGTMTTNDTELTIVNQQLPAPIVGFRFAGVPVEQGTIIQDAYLQFTAAATGSSAAFSQFTIEDVGNSNAFSAANFNLSSRTFGGDVLWTDLVPAWIAKEAGEDQRTPALTSIVQPIINRGDWQSGNALSIFVRVTGGSTSSDGRFAVAYEGNPMEATQFCYLTEETTGTPPCVGQVCDDGNALTIDDRLDENCNCVGAPMSATICNRISDGFNDVEQLEDGSVYDNSTDIELVFDDNNQTNRGNQIIGLRFEDMQIPRDAIISDAYIQFTVDENNSEATNLTILGEDVDNSSPFIDVIDNVSDRNQTSFLTITDWDNVPAWSGAGQAGLNQRTPDVSPIVKEIVDRCGWQRGNAMSFIIEGSGQRTAESYDGFPARAPEVCVDYIYCDPSRNTTCFYFDNIDFWGNCLYAGDTVQLSCAADLSDAAIEDYFSIDFNSSCQVNELSCTFCNEGESPKFGRKRRGGSTLRDKDDQLFGKQLNPNVCYLEEITVSRCADFRDPELGFVQDTVVLTVFLEVTNTIPPTFTVPAATEVVCAQLDNLSITGNVTDASDDCGVFNISYSDDINVSCTIQTPTTVTRTWTVSDSCGNETVKTQLLTVNPNPDCDGTNLNITNNQSGTQTFAASNTIESTSMIQANANVSFYAGQSITLKNGFHAKQNATFFALLQDCNQTAPNRPNSEHPKVYLPEKTSDLQVSPNPFGQQTNISYRLEQDSELELLLFDLKGRMVRTILPTTYQQAGSYQLELQQKNLTEGLYLIRLKTATDLITQRIVIH